MWTKVKPKSIILNYIILCSLGKFKLEQINRETLLNKKYIYNNLAYTIKPYILKRLKT